jgi:hypothetical protein
MTSTPQENTQLGRLVLFMVCLAIAASVVAGVHYFAVDQPLQKYVQAPLNSGRGDDPCSVQEQQCIASCNGLIVPEEQACIRSCGEAASLCRGNPPGDDPYKPKFDGPQ